MHASIRLLVASITALGACGAAGAAPDEGEGLKVQLPSVQGRVRLGLSATHAEGWLATGQASEARLSGASFLGDYYFGGRHATRDGESAGFRATSGVYLGSRASLWGQTQVPAGSTSLLTVERHSFSLAAPASTGEGDDAGSATVPYLGLGYSSQSLKWGLSFSADFGLMALNPGGALRLGRAFGGGQSVDDLLRDLRLSPVVQLGVSYSF